MLTQVELRADTDMGTPEIRKDWGGLEDNGNFSSNTQISKVLFSTRVWACEIWQELYAVFV